MPNNNAVRRIQAKRLGLAKGASWGDIRRERQRIASQLGLPRGASFGAIRRRMLEVARDFGLSEEATWKEILDAKWFEEAYDRLARRIREGSVDRGAEEVYDIAELAVEEVRIRGYPALETAEDFFRLVLGTEAVVENFLSQFRHLPFGDVPLAEEIYLLLAGNTWMGLEEEDLDRFRLFAREERVYAPFVLEAEADELPPTMQDMRLEEFYDSEEEDRYYDEYDMDRYSFSDEEEDDFLYGPVPENYIPMVAGIRLNSPDMVG
jgi:hypothetical protein